MTTRIRYTLLSLRDLAVSIGPFALLTVLLLGMAYWWLNPNPPKRVVLATGPAQSAYDEFGKRYAEALARYGIAVELLPSEGSSDNLELIRSGKADLGFVQGGSADIGYDDEESIVSLGSLFVEPLWLFYREAAAHNMPTDGTVTTLAELKGWRVNVGTPGSGVPRLFSTLLDVNRVERREVQLSELAQTPATVAFLDGELDAVVFASAPESLMVQMLLQSPGIQLLDFAQSEAYSRRFGYLTPVVMPQGVVDLAEEHSWARHAAGGVHHQPAGQHQDPPGHPAAVCADSHQPARWLGLVQPGRANTRAWSTARCRSRRRRCARSATGRRSCSATCLSGWPTWSSACGWPWA